MVVACAVCCYVIARDNIVFKSCGIQADAVVAACASSCADYVVADERVVCVGYKLYSEVVICAVCCDVVACDVVS